jgi:MFS family permease
MVGLYIRLALTETPVFAKILQKRQQVTLPFIVILKRHFPQLVLGSLAMVVCYALFYIATVFSLGYGTNSLHIPRQQFLGMLSVAIIFMALAIPISAWAADYFGRRPVLLIAGAAALLSGFAMEPMLDSGSPFIVTAFLALELFLMGATFAPMGALLPELFPSELRYTGAGTAYNLGGILGASFAPYLAQRLVNEGGLAWVGGYVSLAAGISLIAVYLIPETHKNQWI